jgi:hypothetical protein
LLLQKTIDHRGRESVEFDPNFILARVSSCQTGRFAHALLTVQPDDFEKHERDSDTLELEGRSEREEIASAHDQGNEGKHKAIAWFWVGRHYCGTRLLNSLAGLQHLISSTLRKSRGHTVSVKKVDRGIQVGLS